MLPSLLGYTTSYLTKLLPSFSIKIFSHSLCVTLGAILCCSFLNWSGSETANEISLSLSGNYFVLIGKACPGLLYHQSHLLSVVKKSFVVINSCCEI